MKTVCKLMLEELTSKLWDEINSIEEGNATVEQQDRIDELVTVIRFQLDRYMLFDPIPLTKQE